MADPGSERGGGGAPKIVLVNFGQFTRHFKVFDEIRKGASAATSSGLKLK